MDTLPFNLIDIAVVGIILVSGALAFWRGFLREVLSIIAWIVAVVLTLQLLPLLRPFARRYIDIDILADSVTAGGIFVISLVIFSVVSGMIAGRVRSSGMNTLDRSLGVLFGLLRGSIIVSLAFMAVFLLYRDRGLPEQITAARVTPTVHMGAKLLLYLVPEELSTGSRRMMNEFDALSMPRIGKWNSGSGTDSEAEKGYKTDTRKDLNRLIRRTQK
ncbi:MAG TPA: CvpA family protein [Sneathiellales bacterium]|nr:CvpA family protein [Sneathiellales bacterium]